MDDGMGAGDMRVGVKWGVDVKEAAGTGVVGTD